MEALDDYLKALSRAQMEIEDLLVNSIRGHYGFNRRNQTLASIGKRIQDLVRKLEALEDDLLIEELAAKRTAILNNIYVNAYSFLSSSPQMYRESAANIAREIDNIFSITYRNGAKHNVIEYLDAYIDGELATYAKNELVARARREGITYGYVSRNSTARTCYICRPWMGRVGTIGVDVPGYVRLDHYVPFHIRCIHYIIPTYIIPEYVTQPEDWMLSADRKEYYRRFAATPEGREILREQRKEHGKFNKGNRLSYLQRKLNR